MPTGSGRRWEVLDERTLCSNRIDPDRPVGGPVRDVGRAVLPGSPDAAFAASGAANGVTNVSATTQRVSCYAPEVVYLDRLEVRT